MPKYKLKEGVVLKPFGVGSLLTNDNITDSIVEMLIEKKRVKKEDFIIKNTRTKNGNNK